MHYTQRFFLLPIDVISDDNKIQLWWGPFPFVFDNVTFYQLVYKKTDNEPPRNEVSTFLITSRGAGTGDAGGAIAPPIFASLV